jgi:hypothetical protein
MLTYAGTVLMVLVTIIYLGRMKAFDHMRGIRRKFPQPAFLFSLFIFLVGVLAIYFLSIDG